MNLHDQFCSINLSKKFKELGIKKNYHFYWFERFPVDYLLIQGEIPNPAEENTNAMYPAYTVAELFDMLPTFIDTGKIYEPFNYYFIHLKKSTVANIQYIITYICNAYEPTDFSERRLFKNFHNENLAEALAKTLIYLIENNYVKVEDINNA